MSPSIRQSGLSIIELMVALAISSFLILGVSELYLANKKTYLFEQGQEFNQENGRFALAMLSQELAKAGFRRRPDNAVAQDFPQDNAQVNTLGCSFAVGAAVAGNATSVCLRYQARDDQETDCQGKALATQSSELAGNANTPYEYSSSGRNAMIVERFALAADANPGSANAGAKALVCSSNLLACGNGTCTVVSGDTTARQIVSGVRDLRFDYGTGADKAVTGFTLSPANSATNLIRTVRYAALLQTAAAGLRDTGGASPLLTQWNQTYSTDLSDSAYLYQMAQDSITLRNLMP